MNDILVAYRYQIAERAGVDSCHECLRTERRHSSDSEELGLGLKSASPWIRFISLPVVQDQ